MAAAGSAPQVEFSATFEIYPEIAVGDLSQTAITRSLINIGDAEVDRTLEIMRKQRANFEPVVRAAALGDKATLDFAGKIDGLEFDGGKGEDVSVILGEGRLLKDFESHVVGLEAGGARTFELRFPEDYHAREFAGKTATFDVKLKQIAEPRLPPIDAEFAKSLGVADGNLDTMRGEIRENLERETKQRISARLKDQIMQALIDSTKIEVPKSLVELEIERMSAAARQDLEARGIKPGAMPIPRDVFEKQAQRRVTLGLILGEVVKTHGLQAKPEQVRAMVEEQAQTYEQPELTGAKLEAQPLEEAAFATPHGEIPSLQHSSLGHEQAALALKRRIVPEALVFATDGVGFYSSRTTSNNSLISCNLRSPRGPAARFRRKCRFKPAVYITFLLE